jgi:hypothetical protein
MYQERFYRKWDNTQNLKCFRVQVSESDLYIKAGCDLSRDAKELLIKYRSQVEEYIKIHPDFRESLKLCPVEPLVPRIIKEMSQCAQKAGVGPMASVAGAIAEFVGRGLIKTAGSDIIIENGGDIFLYAEKVMRVGLYAGSRVKSISINVRPEHTPCGICTSSGKLGHSLSFGKADSVTVISASCALADAVATSAANKVKSEKDIDKALNYAMSVQGVKGVLIVAGKKIGVQGEVELA